MLLRKLCRIFFGLGACGRPQKGATTFAWKGVRVWGFWGFRLVRSGVQGFQSRVLGFRGLGFRAFRLEGWVLHSGV